jgi:hypothetical protein
MTHWIRRRSGDSRTPRKTRRQLPIEPTRLRSDQPEQVWLLAEVTKDVVHIESTAVGTVLLPRDLHSRKLLSGCALEPAVRRLNLFPQTSHIFPANVNCLIKSLSTKSCPQVLDQGVWAIQFGNPGQMKAQSDVTPIEFGSLDKALSAIHRIRLDANEQEASFEHVQITVHRRLGQGNVARKFGLIDELAEPKARAPSGGNPAERRWPRAFGGRAHRPSQISAFSTY